MNISKTAFGVLAFLSSSLVFAQVGEKVDSRLPPMKKGDWSLIVLPDTQGYSHDRNRELLTWTTEWIHANKANRNIKAVLQVGDIVDNNLPGQWKNVKKSLKKLNGELPYFFAQGNHDIGVGGYALTRDSPYNKYFAPQLEPINQSAFGGSFEKTRYENSYSYLNVGKEKFMVLMLEFAPRDEVLDWANTVVSKHPKHKVMLVVHEYMDEASRLVSADGLPRRTLPTSGGNAHQYPVLARKGARFRTTSKNCGEEIWQKLVSKHPQFEFVFSGHHADYVDSLGNLLRRGRGAAKSFRADDLNSKQGPNRVQQFMMDSQWISNGGDAWMLVVQFAADGSNARAQTYSPLAEFYPHRLASPDVFAEAWNLIRNPGQAFEALNFGNAMMQKP